MELNKKELKKIWDALTLKRKEWTEKEAIEMVQQEGYAIRYISNPSEEVCKLAVKQEGYAIRYISNPSEEVCKLAVKQDGYAIQHISNPSEEVCKLAVQQNGYAIQFVPESFFEEIIDIQDFIRDFQEKLDQLKKHV